MNYQRAIEILEGIKQLREAGENDSPYVCDNIGEVTKEEWDSISHPDHEVSIQIRADINQYIDGFYGLHNWLSHRDRVEYGRDDDEVHAERIIMIDHLINQYKTELKESNHGSKSTQ